MFDYAIHGIFLSDYADNIYPHVRDDTHTNQFLSQTVAH